MPRTAPFCGHTRRFLALVSAAVVWAQFYTTGATQPFTGPLVPPVGVSSYHADRSAMNPFFWFLTSASILVVRYSRMSP